jgi:hypothetical protein
MAEIGEPVRVVEAPEPIPVPVPQPAKKPSREPVPA